MNFRTKLNAAGTFLKEQKVALLYLVAGLLAIGTILARSLSNPIICFISVAAFLIILSFIVSHRLGLICLFILITTCSWVSLDPQGSWNFAYVAFVMAGLTGSAAKVLLRKERPAWSRVGFWFLVIGITALISAVFAVWRYATFEPVEGAGYLNQSVNIWGVSSDAVILNALIQAMIYLAWGGIFLASLQISRQRIFFKDFRRVLLPVAAANALVAALQLFFLPTVFTSEKWSGVGQATGLMIDSNAFGMTCAVILAASPIWLPRKWRSCFSSILTLLLLAFCVPAAGSRSAFLLVAVFAVLTIIFSVIHFLARKNFSDAVKIVALAALVLIAIVVSWQAVAHTLGISELPLVKRLEATIAYVFSGSEINQILAGRFAMWGNATWLALSHPLSGVGPGTFFCEIGNFSALNGAPLKTVDNALNLYLHVFAELGVVALIALVIAWSLIVKGQFDAARRTQGPRALREFLKSSLILALLAVFFFGPHLDLPEPMVITMLFLGLTARRSDDGKAPRRPPTFTWRSVTAWIAIFVVIACASAWTSYEIHPSKRWPKLRWHIDAGFYEKENIDEKAYIFFPAPDSENEGNGRKVNLVGTAKKEFSSLGESSRYYQVHAYQRSGIDFTGSFTVETRFQASDIGPRYYCLISMGWPTAGEFSWALTLYLHRFRFCSSVNGKSLAVLEAHTTDIEPNSAYIVRVAYRAGKSPAADIWINGKHQVVSGHVAKSLHRSKAPLVINAGSAGSWPFRGRVGQIVLADSYQPLPDGPERSLENAKAEFFSDIDEKSPPFKWTGKLAVRTVKPRGRILHLYWRAGQERASRFVQRSELFLSGKPLGSTEFADHRWKHSLFKMENQADRHERLAFFSEPPFVPDDLLGNGDTRELGPAVAIFELVDELERDSYGFWAYEKADREFQWSKDEGYRKVELGDRALIFSIKAAHPDIRDKPVTVWYDINGACEKKITLTDYSWREVKIKPDAWLGTVSSNPESGKPSGYLHFRVSRTWVPADVTDSEDHRHIGIAVSRIRLAEPIDIK